jgi:hypothetical protein
MATGSTELSCLGCFELLALERIRVRDVRSCLFGPPCGGLFPDVYTMLNIVFVLLVLCLYLIQRAFLPCSVMIQDCRSV